MNTERQIVVLGSNGMLGRYVVKYFQRKNIKVIALTRKDIDVAEAKLGFLDSFDFRLNEYDVVINTAGVIKSQVNKDNVENTIKVNSIFPYILQEECERLNVKAIHISTDCVYNGRGYFSACESTPHNAEDLYGKSKSIGEAPGMTTIRTSIIGEEVGQSRSLIEWVKSQKNNKVTGFKNHFWNGVTCLQLCKVIHTMIDEDFFWNGVRHIFSPKPITKYSLIKLISNQYNLGLELLESKKRSNFCNRTLNTEFQDTKDILEKIPNYKTQLEELKDFDIK
jgi:dTDP-4-dehydrorhamnose reductase